MAFRPYKIFFTVSCKETLAFWIDAMVTAVQVIGEVSGQLVFLVIDVECLDDSSGDFEERRWIVSHVRDESYHERIVSQRKLGQAL